ncbi:MAG: SDR family NAD(P)-dependent oxidoreductase [Chloroflexota bacterium]|nr:SDR family NAD(P)-dependent oxidoreductase [Chloroflexota bacterium]
MRLPEELQFIQNSWLPQKSTNARMDGKVCVLTGATSGIGYEAAKRLAEAGAALVLVCRNPEKAERVRQELIDAFEVDVSVVIADFQSLSEVREAALAIQQAFPAIHVLINNAGVFNKRRRMTPDGNEMIFGVIHLASFLLTQLLKGNLIQGAPARVLYISSEGHRFGGFSLKDPDWHKRPYIGLLAYGAAKIAQIHTALVLAEELQETGVGVNLMHPGAVRTNIGMNNNFLYRFYSRYILGLFLKDPAISADAIYYLVADPSLEGVTGQYFNLTIEEQPARYAVRADQRDAAWELSMNLIRPYLEGEL